jgi:hypothetical protein
MEKNRNACKILVGKPKGKTTRGTYTQVEGYGIDLREIGWDGMGWIHLAKDREKWRALVNTVLYFWVP